MDQSLCSLLQSPQRRTAAALTSGNGREVQGERWSREDGWIRELTGDGASTLALASLILSAFSIPCALLLRRIGVYSTQSALVQEVEREGLREMRGEWRRRPYQVYVK